MRLGAWRPASSRAALRDTKECGEVFKGAKISLGRDQGATSEERKTVSRQGALPKFVPRTLGTVFCAQAEGVSYPFPG